MKIGAIEIEKCQYCGAEDLRYGYYSGNTRMYGATGFLDNQEEVHHIICAACGAIVYSWVKNPRKYSNVPDSAL